MEESTPVHREPDPIVASPQHLSVRTIVSIAAAAVAMQLTAWVALWEIFGNVGLGYQFFALSDILFAYRPYALNLAHGMAAYRDFFIEYPPLFVPLLFAGGNPTSASSYVFSFALTMALFMIAAGVITSIAAADATSTQRPYVVAGIFAIFVLLLGPISANRYDATVAFVLAVALLLMMRERWEAAGIAIGLGFALKITPALLLPLVLVLAPKRRAVRAFAGFAVTAAVPFLWVLALGGSSGAALGRMLAYHLSRPLEVESVLATPLWIARLAGVPIHVGHAARSQVLQTSVADALAAGSALVLLVALAATFWLVWRCRSSVAHSARLIAFVSLLTILASLVGSKVLSPQYFVWLIPALAVVAADRKVLGTLLGAAMALTQVLFPANYTALIIGQPAALISLLIARNMLVLAAFAVGLWQLWLVPTERREVP